MAAHREFLVTDWRGGFFCGTFSGEIQRRWHGLWIAEKPPRQRKRILAGMDLCLNWQGRDIWLTSHWEGNAWVPADVACERDEENGSPRWRLGGDAILIVRPQFIQSGSVNLEFIFLGSASAHLRCRFLHPESIDPSAVILGISSEPEIGKSDEAIEYLRDVSLEIEKDCERVWTENLPRKHGFLVSLQSKKPFDVSIGVKHAPQLSAGPSFPMQGRGYSHIVIPLRWGGRDFADRLDRAAAQFIARGADNSTTILAGYPWFSDWGRDSMIAIPGLCIATKRIAEGREIVTHFLNHLHQGLIPNIFPDSGDQPRYNTVDATLWLIDVVFRLWTIDEICKSEVLWPKLKEIITWHESGTLNNIHVDQDGLLAAGSPGTQLTWMDVKVNGEVPTPRHGKPVEIQGLWFNALRLVAAAAHHRGEAKIATQCDTLAKKAESSFALRYISAEKQHLADVIDRDAPGEADWSIRPNMVIPFSLHHNIIPPAKRADVLRAAANHLLTPRGLRTLSQDHPDYHGTYRGDVIARDHAYHQGTVWMWLAGPYVKGVVAERTSVPELYAQLPALATGLINHFENEACRDQCNEIFDGNAPHTPRGCFAQAWSTAALIEILQSDFS